MAATSSIAVTSCTRTTPRCPDARAYDRALQPCCRAHVRLLVETVAQAFASAGVIWWADYGTLLGAVRNPMTTWADYPWLDARPGPIPPGIIPHDKDADCGALMSHWALAYRVLRRAAATHRFELIVRLPRASMKVRLSRLNHTNLDIFFWDQRPDGTMYRRAYASVDDYKGREFHRSLLHPLGTVEWEGLALPAPRDPQAFLAMRYGPNWRTPVMANHDGVAR